MMPNTIINAEKPTSRSYTPMRNQVEKPNHNTHLVNLVREILSDGQWRRLRDVQKMLPVKVGQNRMETIIDAACLANDTSGGLRWVCLTQTHSPESPPEYVKPLRDYKTKPKKDEPQDYKKIKQNILVINNMRKRGRAWNDIADKIGVSCKSLYDFSYKVRKGIIKSKLVV